MSGSALVREIKPAEQADIDALRTLVTEYMWLKDSWAWRPGGPPSELPVPLSRIVDDLPGDARPPMGSALLATIGDEEVGCVLARSAGRGRVALSCMYVRPHARRHGVASSMIGKLIDRARANGVRTVGLDVLPSRRGAIELYEKHGFEIAGTSPGPPTPMVLMEVHLSSL